MDGRWSSAHKGSAVMLPERIQILLLFTHTLHIPGSY